MPKKRKTINKKPKSLKAKLGFIPSKESLFKLISKIDIPRKINSATSELRDIKRVLGKRRALPTLRKGIIARGVSGIDRAKLEARLNAVEYIQNNFDGLSGDSGIDNLTELLILTLNRGFALGEKVSAKKKK